MAANRPPRSRTDLYRLISRNKRSTVFFVFLISLLLAAVGAALGWYFDWGLEIYLLFGAGIVIYNLVLYYNSDRLALAVNRARPADIVEHRQLHNIVEEVAIAAGLPKPRVYVIPTDVPNAFATGRNPKNAAIAVTTGLMTMMNREELQGVVAHEIAHIRNWDILLMTVVAIVGGLIVLLRDVFLHWGLFFGGGRRSRRSSSGGGQAGLIIILVGVALAILAPLLVALIRAAISRQREYLADASGAFIVRNPHGLASALDKLGGTRAKLATASDATAHMFIASPFAKDRANTAGAFASHPPLTDRVSRLRSLTVPTEPETDR